MKYIEKCPAQSLSRRCAGLNRGCRTGGETSPQTKLSPGTQGIEHLCIRLYKNEHYITNNRRFYCTAYGKNCTQPHSDSAELKTIKPKSADRIPSLILTFCKRYNTCQIVIVFLMTVFKEGRNNMFFD